jgi:copper resistance protein C
MKKLVMSFFILLVSFYPNLEAFAHSYAKSSSPAEGEIVTKPLKVIGIIFETDIEQMGQLSLSNQNETTEIKDISIEGDTLIGRLDSPLKSGQYEANWKIVGEDGHPIEGKITFSVDLPAKEPAQSDNGTKEEEESVQEEQADVEQDVNSPEEKPNEDQTSEENVKPTPEETMDTKKSNGVQFWLLPLVAVVALLAAFFIFSKGKK